MTFWMIVICFVLTLAMHAAAAAGHASTVRVLLLAGGITLMEATDLSKRTPLSRACEMGRASVVETLIDSGAKVDVKDQDGQSLLHWSVGRLLSYTIGGAVFLRI